MKKFYSILLACSIFAAACPVAMAESPHGDDSCIAASDKNLLGLGDFETVPSDITYGTGTHEGKISNISNIIKPEYLQHCWVVGYSDTESYCGNKSLEMYHGKSTSAYYPVLFYANGLQTNAAYRFSGWVKLKENAEGVSRTGKTNMRVKTNDVYTIIRNEIGEVTELKKRWGNYSYTDGLALVDVSTEKWTYVSAEFYVPKLDDSTTKNVRFSFTGGIEGFYVDDVCLEKIGDLEVGITGNNSIEIPKIYEESVQIQYNTALMIGDSDLTASITTAQLGSIPQLTLKEDYEGVSLEGNTLTVDNTAYESEIVLVGTSGGITKEYTVNLTYSGEKKPQVRNITLNGSVSGGQQLTLNYIYYDPSGIGKKTESFLWQGRNTEEEDWQTVLIDEVPATGRTLNIDSEFPYNMVRCAVEVTNDSDVGSGIVYSNIATRPVPPEARNITVTGDAFVGETITTDYEWYDANDVSKEKRGTDILQWYRLDTPDGPRVPVEVGGNELSYTLTSDDACKYLQFGVIPVSLEEPYYAEDEEGREYYSELIQGPLRPVASNATITKSKGGRVLTATYDYSHPQNIKEGESEYAWYINGRLVSRELAYTVPSNVAGNVYFEVTPIAEKEPFEGETIRSNTVKVNTMSTGGGGGGGGGSSVSPSGSFSGSVGGKKPQSEPIQWGTNVGEAEKPTEDDNNQSTNTTFADIENHWAKECIEELASAGIINGKSDNSFEPDSNVKRAEFCTMIYRALGLDAFSGDQKFGDVAKDAWYYEAVQAVADKGIINGDGQNFNPDKEMTRQEMAKVIWGAVSDKVSALPEGEVSYTDSDSINDWANDAIVNLSLCKILEGSNGEFRPLHNMTRAEAATVISRAIKLIKGGK